MSADGAAPTGVLDCPFCAEPVRDTAVVCPHCTRDLAIPKPLLLRQREQALEIEALRAELLELRAERAMSHDGDPAAASAWAPLVWPALGWAGTLGLVLAAHWLLVIRHDAAVAVLRAACIGLPFLAALATPGLGRVPLPLLVGASLALGGLAVTGMSWTVHRVDGTPVVPVTARDLYEMLEFSVAIALSFLAGALARRLARLRREDRRATAAPGPASLDRLSHHAHRVGRLAETLSLAATATGAVIAGFRALFQ